MAAIDLLDAAVHDGADPCSCNPPGEPVLVTLALFPARLLGALVYGIRLLKETHPS